MVVTAMFAAVVVVVSDGEAITRPTFPFFLHVFSILSRSGRF